MAIKAPLKQNEFRHNIQESRQKFLDILCNSSIELDENEHQNENFKKKPRKISFKVRKTSSTYRKNHMPSAQRTTISASTVAELASKFNEIIEKNNSTKEDVNFKKLVEKLGHSNRNNVITLKQTNVNSNMETHKKDRKPSIKKKPTIDDKAPKVQIIRKKSSNTNITTKISETKKEASKIVLNNQEIKIKTELKTIPKSPIIESRQETTSLGFVRAAIENFERNRLKPNITKRSISEFNCSHYEETTEVAKNRRKSCKPDINSIPIKNANETISDETLAIDERKSDLIDKVESPDYNKPENVQIISTPTSSAAKGNEFSVMETVTIIKEFSEKPLSLYHPHKNSLGVDKTDSNISQLHKRKKPNKINDLHTQNLTEYAPNLAEYFEECEKNYIVNTKSNDNQEINEIVEAINLSVDEPCYSITDIVNIPPEMTDIDNENEDKINDKRQEETKELIKPNASFLWAKSSSNFYQDLPKNDKAANVNTIRAFDSTRAFNDKSTVRTASTLPKDFKNSSAKTNETIYEELDPRDDYEPIDFNNTDYELVEPKEEIKEESDYEFLQNEENIYETLPSASVPRPASKNSGSYCTIKNEETISNCYESICNVSNSTVTHSIIDNNYESIYFGGHSVKRNDSEKDMGSITSSEQITNSLYGTTFYGASIKSWNDGVIYNGSAISDLSYSDKSEWVDVSENEDDKNSKIVIIKEASQKRRSGNWSQHCRKQWSKLPSQNNEGGDSDSDHLYETLRNSDDEGQDFCYDSFASDIESDDSFDNADNTVNNGDLPLPSVPSSNDVLARLAASASKHMRKFTKNLSMTRNDISKSLTRIAIRRKSKNDVNEANDDHGNDNIIEETAVTTAPTSPDLSGGVPKTEIEENNEKNKSLTRKGFLNRIRRSIIMTPEQANEITSQFNKGKSTFYLTSTIDIDGPDDVGEKKTEDDSGISLSPIERSSKRSSRNKLVRPQNPPPPAPNKTLNEDLKKAFKDKRSPSWYVETSLYRQQENKIKYKEKRPSACWYDEISLYPNTASTPSTSSAENSGTNTHVNIGSSSNINNDKEISETYYNLNNENNYYNESMQSLNSNGTKTDLSLNSLSGDDIQMRLQNEPLYQFYDAAVLESVCNYGVSDLDSDNYEDIETRYKLDQRPPSRPSAMELIVPKRNSLAFTKTLWCEIPEVLQSSVLSTLSSHQKKLQEAKFEMVTSEASYLNSLNVLNDHFMQNLRNVLTGEEFLLLFGKIEAVRQSSDNLLLDLEKCWQDNILLHGVCDIIQKHAEENFSVYIPYCENHMLLDRMTKKLKERSIFSDTLKQLESSPVCQSLSLYSFLMLPMQRITRWPLLLDAVLKRLEQHDPEYITCQYVLATINKIVNQCNEAARNKERELEMIDIESKMEFAKGVQSFELTIPNRWLVRSGIVTHMQAKSDEIKLTFGKRFTKTSLHLFLFNDLLVVAKPKSENHFSVLHYCSRNFTELSISDQLISVPGKEGAGKYLFFLTILENQNKKMVEFLLSCSSESDKQRWIEALSPLKSEDPDEVLYECWDCPQITVIHNYAAVQPDELSLVKGDIINVSRKMTDGWYQGERIRDGQTGWFPANYTAEIANPHVRARNLKQRYRLLTFSENYLRNK